MKKNGPKSMSRMGAAALIKLSPLPNGGSPDGSPFFFFSHRAENSGHADHMGGQKRKFRGCS